MKKFIKTAGLAVALAAMAVSSASATTGPGMIKSVNTIGTGSNTGAVSGLLISFVGHSWVFGGGAARAQCADATFNITSVTTTDVKFHMSHSGGCTFSLNGTVLGTAAVDTTTEWTYSGAGWSFNSATGAGSGMTVTNSATKITVPGIACTVNINAQTKGGISTQNVDASGANSAAATPWGSKIIAAVTGLSYTTTGSCPGLTGSGTDGSYSGTVAVANVFGSL